MAQKQHPRARTRRPRFVAFVDDPHKPEEVPMWEKVKKWAADNPWKFTAVLVGAVIVLVWLL